MLRSWTQRSTALDFRLDCPFRKYPVHPCNTELVQYALVACGRWDKNAGGLPARFMVCFRLAPALFQQDSYDDVAENLRSSGAVHIVIDCSGYFATS